MAGEPEDKGGAKTAEEGSEKESYSKEEYDKLQGQLDDLKGRLEEATRELSDPDLLEYKADKRRREERGDDEEGRGKRDGKGAAQPPVDLTKIDWEELREDPKKLVGLIVQVIRGDVRGLASEIKGEFDTLYDEVDNLKTAHEIDRVAARYEDFYDLKDDILKLARTNPGASVFDLYKQVKGDKLLRGEIKPEAPPAKRRGTEQERPGGISPRATKPSKKKSLEEALDDAFEVAGIAGDTIG